MGNTVKDGLFLGLFSGLMKPLSGCGMMSLFSTHLPAEQRVQRLLGTV